MTPVRFVTRGDSVFEPGNDQIEPLAIVQIQRFRQLLRRHHVNHVAIEPDLFQCCRCIVEQAKSADAMCLCRAAKGRQIRGFGQPLHVQDFGSGKTTTSHQFKPEKCINIRCMRRFSNVISRSMDPFQHALICQLVKRFAQSPNRNPELCCHVALWRQFRAWLQPSSQHVARQTLADLLINWQGFYVGHPSLPRSLRKN